MFIALWVSAVNAVRQQGIGALFNVSKLLDEGFALWYETRSTYPLFQAMVLQCYVGLTLGKGVCCLMTRDEHQRFLIMSADDNGHM
jgi:hypothetical protein